MQCSNISFLCAASTGLSLLFFNPVYADGTDEPIPTFYEEPGNSPHRGSAGQHPKEHIDPFTGKLQWHAIDLSIPGNGGLTLSVQRSYTSPASAFPSPSNAGVGWTMHFGKILRTSEVSLCDTSRPDANTNPVWELPDGSRQILYVNNDKTGFLSSSFWRGVCSPDRTMLMVYSPDGMRYDVNTVGLPEGPPERRILTYYVSKISDHNDNNLVIAYAFGTLTSKVTSVTASDGRLITFTYTGDLVKSVTDGSRVWNYEYAPSTVFPGLSYLTKVTRPDGISWNYSYLDTPSVVGQGALTQVTYPTGGTINYTYGYVDFQNIEILPPSTVVKTKSAEGANWTFDYKPATTPLPVDSGTWTEATLTVNNVDQTTVTGPDGQRVYRHIGLTSVSSGSIFLVGTLLTAVEGSAQAKGYSWGFQQISNQENRRPGYLGFAKIDPFTAAPVMTRQEINRDGFRYVNQYEGLDIYGNPGTVTETGTDARKTTITYDINLSKWILRQKKSETILYTTPTTPQSMGTITRNFDANGNLLQENKFGVVTDYTYTPSGDIATRKDANGNVITYSNYKRGIPQREDHPEGVVITRIVDNAGNITSETDGENATITYTYDGLNRLTSIKHPLGNQVTVDWTANTRKVTRGSYVELSTFDGFGRQIRVDRQGVTPAVYQTTRYDAVGRTIFQSYLNSSTGAEFSYDILGRPLTAKQPSVNGGNSERIYQYQDQVARIQNERGQTYTYRYQVFGDPDQRALVEINAPDSDANILITRDGLGQMLEVKQGGKTRSYAYNARRFLTSQTNPETGTTTFGRDNVGNMTSRQVGTTPVVGFVYDGLNRLKQTNYSGMPAVVQTYYRDSRPKSLDNGYAKRDYVYDTNKNLKTETLTVGTRVFPISYGYDANDALSTLTYGSGKTVSYSPNAFGRPTAAMPYVSAVSYHPNGQISSMTHANGVVTTMGQNARQWPQNLKITGAQPMFDSNFSYDDTGNLLGMTDAVDATYNRSMTYDRIDRLSSAAGPWGFGSFAYDGRGNITRQTLGTYQIGYVYDATTDRLTSTTGSRAGNLSYDNFGNVTNNGVTTFAYDNASTMQCARCGQADQTTYSYDGAGMRVSATQNGVTTYFVYGRNGSLLSESIPGNYVKEYIYLGNKQVATRRQAP